MFVVNLVNFTFSSFDLDYDHGTPAYAWGILECLGTQFLNRGVKAELFKYYYICGKILV